MWFTKLNCNNQKCLWDYIYYIKRWLFCLEIMQYLRQHNEFWFTKINVDIIETLQQHKTLSKNKPQYKHDSIYL